MAADATTLAEKLGGTAHLSFLLLKARRLGLCGPEDLERLAVARGCTYYSDGTLLPEQPVSREAFPDAELAVALLHSALRYDPRTIRLGAAMLGSPRNNAADVAWLARLERCESIVREIAEAGSRFEPENAFWQELLVRLPPGEKPKPGVIPHATRFVAMTGLTRHGKEMVASWIRPEAA